MIIDAAGERREQGRLRSKAPSAETRCWAVRHDIAPPHLGRTRASQSNAQPAATSIGDHDEQEGFTADLEEAMPNRRREAPDFILYVIPARHGRRSQPQKHRSGNESRRESDRGDAQKEP